MCAASGCVTCFEDLAICSDGRQQSIETFWKNFFCQSKDRFARFAEVCICLSVCFPWSVKLQPNPARLSLSIPSVPLKTAPAAIFINSTGRCVTKLLRSALCPPHTPSPTYHPTPFMLDHDAPNGGSESTFSVSCSPSSGGPCPYPRLVGSTFICGGLRTGESRAVEFFSPKAKQTSAWS